MLITTSKSGPYEEAYVWIWLPEATAPVVAGKLSKDGEMLKFNYGKSYTPRFINTMCRPMGDFERLWIGRIPMPWIGHQAEHVQKPAVRLRTEQFVRYEQICSGFKERLESVERQSRS